MKLSDLIKELIRFFDLQTDEDLNVWATPAGVTIPMEMGDHKVKLLDDAILATIESGDFDIANLDSSVAYFLPLAEDHSLAKSHMYTALELAIRTKANVKAWAVMTALMELCGNVKGHKKMPAAVKRLIAEVGEVDEKTVALFNKMCQTTDMMTKGLIFHTSLRYNADLGDRSYKRVAGLTSDFIADLREEEPKVLGTTVSRKKDRRALAALFTALFPDFESTTVQTFTEDGDECPNLVCLVKMGSYIDAMFKRLADEYPKIFDEGLLEVLNSVEPIEIENITQFAKQCLRYPIPYNDGIPKAGPKRAQAVKREPETKQSDIGPRATSSRVVSAVEQTAQPTQTNKGNGKMTNTNNKRLLGALGSGRRNSPKSASSSAGARRNNRATDGLIWVQNDSYDAGGYYIEDSNGPRTGNGGRNNGRRPAGRNDNSLAARMMGRRTNDNQRGARGTRQGGRGTNRNSARGARRNVRQNNEPFFCLELGNDIIDFFEEDIRGAGNDCYVVVDGEKFYLDDLGVNPPRNTRRPTRQTAQRNNEPEEEPAVILQLDDLEVEFWEEDIRRGANGDYVIYDGVRYEV